MALAHAEKHGDATYLALLANTVPAQYRGRIVQWAATVSPVALLHVKGEMVARVRKVGDFGYQHFDSGRATAVAIFDIETTYNPLGEQFARQQLAKETRGKSIKACINIVRHWFSVDARKMQLDEEIGHQSFSRLSEGVSLRTHAELIEMYAKCVNVLTAINGEQAIGASELRSSILSEWKKRLDASLVDEFFEWPSTDAPPGANRLGAIASPAEGMLSALGYHVGEVSGRPEYVRRFMLDDAFSIHLPPINSPSYMREWEAPASAGRLHKIAETLAALARNEKRRGLKTAPDQREEDLGYLYQRYYVGRFAFGWTNV